MENIRSEEIRKFVRVSRMHRRCVENAASRLNVNRSQHELLITLAHNPDFSQHQLAERLGITPAAVTLTVRKLAEAGLLSVETDPADVRRRRLSITEAGHALLAEGKSLFDDVGVRMLAGLGEEELAVLDGIFSRMQENLCRLQEEQSSGKEIKDK